MAVTHLTLFCAYPGHPGPVASGQPLGTWSGDLALGQTPPAVICEGCSAHPPVQGLAPVAIPAQAGQAANAALPVAVITE